MSDDDEPVIGVDIDQCLGAFIGNVRRGLWEQEGVYVRHEEIVEYAHLPERAGMSMKDAVERTHENEWPDAVPEFPGEIEVLEGAEAALDALSEEYRVVTVTARPEEFEEGTRAWLDANDLAYDEHRHADAKDECTDLDCLIDDGTRHVTDFAATGRPAILFGQPWNDPDGDLDVEGPGSIVRVEAATEREQWSRVVDAVERFVEADREPESLLDHVARTGSNATVDDPGDLVAHLDDPAPATEGLRRIDRIVAETTDREVSTVARDLEAEAERNDDGAGETI